jgi:hypothetical protein
VNTHVSAAMPRRLLGSQGKEAEHATHDAAAIWGLADFVFEPAVRHRASGVRELGDRILVLGVPGRSGCGKDRLMTPPRVAVQCVHLDRPDPAPRECPAASAAGLHNGPR